jgi:hypothetical protein
MKINEIAEKMIKRGFESNDINESGFLDELSWIVDFELVNKKYLTELKAEMELVEQENHPKPKSLGEYLEKIGEV